jgi:O6-methylguanine-DNA--protein-cysteine methyltransferase
MPNTNIPRNLFGDDLVVARWTYLEWSWLIQMCEEGVRLISHEKDFDPTQMVMWTDHPRLATVKPYGQRLAYELHAAISGCPVKSEVPWTPSRPAWHVEVYRELLRLPPGQVTDLFAVVSAHRWPHTKKAILQAVRECPLAPLCPLHRVAGSPQQPIRFPWGHWWRNYMLEQERQAYRQGEKS